MRRSDCQLGIGEVDILVFHREVLGMSLADFIEAGEHIARFVGQRCAQGPGLA